MIHNHYRNTENRKAELDPATFEYAEDWQADHLPRWWEFAIAVPLVLAGRFFGWVKG